MDKLKIIDKIHKCLRLAHSGNANESAAALRQARGLMRKYGIAESEVKLGRITEATAARGGYFNPPFWAVALSDLVAKAFDCRAYITNADHGAEFRFFGVDASSEVSAYTFTVLYRQLRRARIQYLNDLALEDRAERTRRGNVYAQAWLYRIAQTVSEFVCDPTTQTAIDSYVREHYGESPLWERDPAQPESGDYDVIVSGLRAAQEVILKRPVTVQSAAVNLADDIQVA